jgi:DNA-directed RNA polymerase specialized sigma24 family protein
LFEQELRRVGDLDLSRLYLEYGRELELVIRRARPGSLRRDQVEDAIQESFKVLLEHAVSKDNPPWRDIKSYLFGICLRIAAGLRRKEGRDGRRWGAAREALALADHTSPACESSDDALAEGMGKFARDWMASQTEEVQAFLNLRYTQGKSLRTCAASLGLTLWSVRSMEKRILRNLSLSLARR